MESIADLTLSVFNFTGRTQWIGKLQYWSAKTKCWSDPKTATSFERFAALGTTAPGLRPRPSCLAKSERLAE
jgi:hypothetical protein